MAVMYRIWIINDPDDVMKNIRMSTPPACSFEKENHTAMGSVSMG
jgi:hypothetical protein